MKNINYTHISYRSYFKLVEIYLTQSFSPYSVNSKSDNKLDLILTQRTLMKAKTAKANSVCIS